MAVTNRLANAWYIFKTSLSFILKDKSLLAVPIIMVLSVFLFCVGFVFLVINQVMSIIGPALLFILLIYIWTVFLSAAQAWMVHEVAQGKNTTLSSGFKRAIKNLWDIILFVLAKLIIGVIVGSIRKKFGAVGNVAGSFIQLITGIAGKLVLPAMIVTERSFMDSIKQLGKAVKAIPEIATFEIGIRPLTALIFWLSMGLGLVIGFSMGIYVGIIFFVVILLINIMFSVLINQVYYTLLYLTLIEKKKVKGLKLHL